ncbi:DUF2510 domain-containing protein [Intrasporangium calvum]|uniref:DUF2510 domain-containing protein n=1 Tax=Intrasporangium calvum TaxID=53358 RepID=A0ABT5GJF5_9MICO|nr:DUF2510 domain-containing protein [Intrasporangium calvum]MDC5698282.1 DUF2510 domain-containing protein [Intrasporangium calvum]
MAEQPQPPAGWYPVGDSERYWDGRAWSDQVRAPAASSAVPPAEMDVHGFPHHSGAPPAPSPSPSAWPAPQPHLRQVDPWASTIAQGPWIHTGPGPHSLVAPKNPALSLLASFFVPGLGSMINGNTARGLGILVGYCISWLLIIVFVGIFGVMGFWIWGMVDAYQGARTWNARHGIIS